MRRLLPSVLLGIPLVLSTTLIDVETRTAAEDPYRISTGSASFAPAPGLRKIEEPSRFILQFWQVPSRRQIQGLSRFGVEVGRYVGGIAYIAHGSGTGAIRALPRFPEIRAALSITPAMRLQSDFPNPPEYREAIANHEPVSVDVRFHESVPFERAFLALAESGIECAYDHYLSGNRLILKIPWPAVERLLRSSEVDEVGPAARRITLTSLRAGKGINVHRVLGRELYRSPTGDGVLVGVTDAWLVDEDHEELAGRVILMHDPTGIDTTDFDGSDFGHGTAMAGTIASAGRVRPATRGPAPNANILSMLFWYEPNNETAYAARNFGLRISHNAWGPDHDDEFLPPKRLTSPYSAAARGLRTTLGYYGNFNLALDKMIREADVLSIWANGNDAYLVPLYPLENGFGLPYVVDGWHRANVGFDTSALPSNSKNTLSIGATMHDDVITGFSSRGPAFDGRLAPHLVTPGYEMQVLSPDNQYGIGSGTSGSSALAAGAAALVLQQYREVHGAEPSSALLKAILINSSLDLGPKGPDYSYGYGKLDAEYAAQTISGHKAIREYKRVKSDFVEETIGHKETQVHTFRITRKAKELRATLVWHDAPRRRLVNDLDLWVRYRDGEEIGPLTLNPSKPQQPAKMKRNPRDTAEHIVVENPQLGPWKVFVRGKKVPKGPQPYSLVIAAGKGNRPPVHRTTGDFTIVRSFSSKGDPDQPAADFSAGDDIYFHTLIHVSANARYAGGYYGTVKARYELRDQEGVLRFVFTTAWDNCAPTVGEELRDVQSRAEDIPDIDMIKGTYRVRSIITMHNGLTETAPDEYEVTVQ